MWNLYRFFYTMMPIFSTHIASNSIYCPYTSHTGTIKLSRSNAPSCSARQISAPVLRRSGALSSVLKFYRNIGNKSFICADIIGCAIKHI